VTAREDAKKRKRVRQWQREETRKWRENREERIYYRETEKVVETVYKQQPISPAALLVYLNNARREEGREDFKSGNG